MNTAEKVIVLAAIAELSWRLVWAWLRAGEVLRRAPWPQARTTPEPCRLRLVRSGPYDWQQDIPNIEARAAGRERSGS